MKKSAVAAFAYWARNLRSEKMFAAMKRYCQGDVLDVGGRDFYLTARELQVPCRTWTTLEPNPDYHIQIKDPKFKCVSGDGCQMQFAANAFDTVLNIQVLEHVFEPLKMLQEIARVLKPSGYAVFLVPQTGVLHELPHHYYNFTPFWVEEALKHAGLEKIELVPLGGFWSSMASHLVYFFFKAFRFPGYSIASCRRNIGFYLLFPLMSVYALLSIPVCLFLSLGDLSEEPNNILFVARKPS